MNSILRWVRSGIRALLVSIVATAMFGAVYWLLGRHSVVDLIGVAILALGWFAIAYVVSWRRLPRDSQDW